MGVVKSLEYQKIQILGELLEKRFKENKSESIFLSFSDFAFSMSLCRLWVKCR